MSITLTKTHELRLLLSAESSSSERILASPEDTLSQLPLEIIYCLFVACDPSALVGLALTNKSNLIALTKWLDTNHVLQSKLGQTHPGDRFNFLAEELRRTSGSRGRREAASILRQWQRRVLTEQGIMSPEKISQWNVCNGCLKFRPQHKTACTRCRGETCEDFLCSIYCAL